MHSLCSFSNSLFLLSLKGTYAFSIFSFHAHVGCLFQFCFFLSVFFYKKKSSNKHINFHHENIDLDSLWYILLLLESLCSLTNSQKQTFLPFQKCCKPSTMSPRAVIVIMGKKFMASNQLDVFEIYLKINRNKRDTVLVQCPVSWEPPNICVGKKEANA